MKKRVDMGPAKEQLEQTYSRKEVMAHFGCSDVQVWRLMTLGAKFRGCHPLKGGLWPWFKPSYKNVRITRTAIDAHKRHMERLATEPMFAAEMKAKARQLGLVDQEAA